MAAKTNFKRTQADTSKAAGDAGMRSEAVNFKRMRGDTADATDVASSKGEDELQGLAVKMRLKRMRGRRDRRNRQHELWRRR